MGEKRPVSGVFGAYKVSVYGVCGAYKIIERGVRTHNVINKCVWGIQSH